MLNFNKRDINRLREEMRERLDWKNDAREDARFMLTNELLRIYGFTRTLEFLCEDPSIGEMDAEIKKTGGYDALKEWKREYSTSELIEPLLYLLEGTNRLEDAEDFPEYKINKVPVEQKLLKQSRKERLADKEHYVSPESFTR